MRPRHLVLVGLMGSGKSTVARRLARNLGLVLVDLDARVEQCAGCTIATLFAQQGEAAFRDLESQMLTEALASAVPSVVATGGGVVVRPGNRDALTRSSRGRVVWLDAAPEVLATRVTGTAATRPLLADDPTAALTRLDAERRAWYDEVADLRIDTAGRSLDDVVDTVEAWWRAQCDQSQGGEAR